MLYQKHRPKTFEEIQGHDKVIQAIVERVKNNDIPQSIFIEGITGTGKTTLAYLLAKAINCKSKDGHNPCNVCASCLDVNNEQFSHSVNFYNASDLDTEAVRDIKNLSQTYNITAEKRVIIIDELQELNNNKKAQKTLLSILEKVNGDTHFILLTMDSSKVDKAIINRCVSYKLFPVDFVDIGTYLFQICEREGIEVDDKKSEILLTISENSGGSVRTATSLLEKVIGLKTWDEETVAKELGLMRQQDLYEICDNLLSGNPKCLNSDLNDEIVNRVKWLLQLVLKSQLGAELNGWEKKQIGQLFKHDVSKTIQVINILNELMKYSYTTKQIIEYHFLLALNSVKQIDNSTKHYESKLRQIDIDDGKVIKENIPSVIIEQPKRERKERTAV